MALSTIDDLAQDPDFRRRAQVAALQLGVDTPSTWVMGHVYRLAASPGFEAAYASACANPYLVRNGDNPAVISDGAILAAVQATWEAEK